jgi:uncharacterized RmlC-like cupin family protein
VGDRSSGRPRLPDGLNANLRNACPISATPDQLRPDVADGGTGVTLKGQFDGPLDRCVFVTASAGSYEGKHGHVFLSGISRETAGSAQLCLHVTELPPGGSSHPHVHRGHESAAYIVSGDVEVRHGEDLALSARIGSGDFVYILAGVPHMPVNLSFENPAMIVVARTDPNEQESVELLDLRVARPVGDRAHPLPIQG